MSAIFSFRLPRRAARALGFVAVAAALSAAGVGLPAVTSGATPPTPDPAVAAGYAGHWLAAQVKADGSVHNDQDAPSAGATLATALGLAAARTDQATFSRTVAWLSDHVDTVTGTGATADPGQIGYLLLVLDAAGRDATTFGGVNLVTRLAGTLGQFEPGLYGKSDPTYDGAFRQSLAILGLAAVGQPEDTTALDWLSAQQCGGADLAVQGGWQAYRAPAAPCIDPDPTTFTGVDSNSTAMAFQALTAAGVAPAADALGWLGRAENPTGGWGLVPGVADDPDSTALAIQAVVAGGQSPTSGVWVKGTNTPLRALLAFQLGCDAPVTDRGAFTYPGGGETANALATQQAVWGAGERAFPLGPVTFGTTADPCAPAATTTSTTAVAQVAAAATPVAATPAVTG